MENQQALENQLKNKFGNSVLFKLGLIGALTLLLLIPANWIQNLILERQNRQEEVIKEISDKWATSQLLEGPVLILPYKTLVKQKDTAGNVGLKEVLTNIYILPENIDIKSNASPEILHRGIFDAVVYNTVIQVKGRFSNLELKKSGIDFNMVQWQNAKVAIGISDIKGLKNNPVIELNGKVYNVEPDFTSLKLFTHNLIILPDLSIAKQSGLDFSFNLDVRGSSELNFINIGKTTTVNISGKWDNPSFTGRYLPEERKITENNFSATWKLPYFNRALPQQWIGDEQSFQNKNEESIFGVKFILPVDQYQKTMRSAKYALLIILLSFISLFFTEVLNKKKIHLFQYILIGASMTIYYTLLLSFSEQVGFNIAYLIASVSTVALISVFISSVLKSKKPALMMGGILSVFYGFIYVIIQLQDMALLFGSIGLFIIIAVMMYLSAGLDWSKNESR